jgi:multiple sugar transport system substrate-binding protein
MLRRWRNAAAWSCWALLAFAAPASSPAAEPKAITVLTRAALNVQEAAAVQAATAAFNRKQHTYKAELLWSSYRNHSDWVQSVAATGALPCVLELDGPLVAQFAWPGYLRPLDRFIPDALRRDLLPSIVAQGTYDGQLYTLGQYDSGLGLWANRRYLAAAGLRLPTVDRPWTLNQFESAMERLSHVQGVDYPLSLGVYSGPTEFYPYAYLPILAGFGGDFIDRAGRGTARGVLDGPASVAAMQRFQHWFDKGWSRAVLDRNDDFEKRHTALLWMGHWKYRDTSAALGEDLVLLPLPDFGHGLKTGMGSWSWGISSTCAEPAGAWAFLAHLMSVDEVARVTNQNGAVPARKSVLAKSTLYGPGRPMHVLGQQLFSGAGVPRPATPGYGVISKSFAGAVTAILAGADVQTELSRAALAIDNDIASNNGYPR